MDDRTFLPLYGGNLLAVGAREPIYGLLFFDWLPKDGARGVSFAIEPEHALELVEAMLDELAKLPDSGLPLERIRRDRLRARLYRRELAGAGQ